MNAVSQLPAAQADLLDIWLRIASDSPANADRFLDVLDQKMHLLASSPRMGRPRPELRDGLRSFPVDHYVIFYCEVHQGINIVRVLHGARDIESLFHDDAASTGTP